MEAADASTVNLPVAEDSGASPEIKNQIPTPHGQPRKHSFSASFDYLSQADRILLRLQKLLTTATGLEAFLSTINYALYIISFGHDRSPSRSAVYDRLRRLIGARPASHSATMLKPHNITTVAPSVPPWKALAALISETRTALRLTALLPLYGSLRKLYQTRNRDGQDRYLQTISLVQCLGYMFFQATENVAFLADKGVISRRWIDQRGGSARWYLWSSRGWLTGVSCDFLALARRAVIQKQNRSNLADKKISDAEREDQQKIDESWYRDLLVASCWLPLCLHGSLDGGLRGVNTGSVGFLGLVAGARSSAVQWAGTEIPPT